jgi:predicted porin
MKKLLIVALALSLTLGFAMTASAAKVTVGGSLRTELSWAYATEEVTGGDDRVSLDTFNISTSRLKVTYLSDDKKFKGYAEIRLRSRSQGLNIDTRHAYFSYSWGDGSLLFGQYSSLENSYGPAAYLRGTTSMIGFGWAYWSRTEQIRLTWGQKFKLKFSINSPRLDGDPVDSDGNTIGDAYQYFPAMAAGLDMSFGNVNVYPWIRWEWERFEMADGTDENWHSLDFGLEFNGDFGLVGFTLGGHYGINTTMSNPNGPSSGPVFNADATDRSDHKQFSVFGEVRIGNLSLGAGYQQASRDSLDGVELWAEDPYTMTAYVNYKVPFGKITFVPEIDWFNHGEDETGADQGDEIVFGVFAMLNF